MRLAYLAVVVATLVNVSGAQPAGSTSSQQPSTPGTVKKILIVVATADAHATNCKGGKYQPVDILVDADVTNDRPSHCVEGKVLEHEKAHGNKATILYLSFKAKESALWYSDDVFRITSIAPHNDKNAATAPKYPFERPLPQEASKAFESGPIIAAAVDHRYKIEFTIGKRKIDPDLWCNP